MTAILILTITALLLSIIIVFVDYEINSIDEKQDDFLRLLPGYNCGMCGFNNCKGMSVAMLEEPNNYKRCKPLKGQNLKDMEDYLVKKNLI